MIKFFRGIRNKLLYDGNFSRYLIYAIGEITLVIIGILIALSINNWNENRKERIQEKEILIALRNDFLESEKRLGWTKESQERVVKYNKRLLEQFDNKNIQQQNDSIGLFFNLGAIAFFRVEPVTGTYDALIGSGKTGLIKNQNLGSLLAKYSTEINMGFEDHEYSMNLLSLIVDKSSEYSGPLLTDKIGKINSNERNHAVISLLNDNSLQGPIILKGEVESRRLKRQKRLINYTTNIIDIIASEIENK